MFDDFIWSNQNDYQEGMHIPSDKAIYILVGMWFDEQDFIMDEQGKLLKRPI